LKNLNRNFLRKMGQNKRKRILLENKKSTSLRPSKNKEKAYQARRNPRSGSSSEGSGHKKKGKRREIIVSTSAERGMVGKPGTQNAKGTCNGERRGRGTSRQRTDESGRVPGGRKDRKRKKKREVDSDRTRAGRLCERKGQPNSLYVKATTDGHRQRLHYRQTQALQWQTRKSREKVDCDAYGKTRKEMPIQRVLKED